MGYLAFLENPWCLLMLLLLVFLLLVAAALLSCGRAHVRATDPLATRRLAPRPEPVRSHEITASAPYEALSALRERLLEIQRHLPPGSDDARWLAGYLHDLHNVMDDVYWSVYQRQGPARTALLEQLSVEVGRLERTISAQLATTLETSTDRPALHAQLERLRRALDHE